MEGWGYVYVIRMEGHPWLKIGSVAVGTADGLKHRLSSMQTGCPLPLSILREYRCLFSPQVEKRLHKILAQYRRRGEWFETTIEVIDDALRSAVMYVLNPDWYLSPRDKKRFHLWRKEWELAAAIDGEKAPEEIERLQRECDAVAQRM